MSRISDKIGCIIFLVLPPSFVAITSALIMTGILYHPDNSVGKFWINEIWGYYVALPMFLSLICAPIFGISTAFNNLQGRFLLWQAFAFFSFELNLI